MDIHLIFYYIGILLIFLVNIYVLFARVSSKMISSYALVNLLGALFIAYYFMYTERFIYF